MLERSGTRRRFLRGLGRSAASPPGRSRGSERFGRTGRCGSYRAREHRHAVRTILLVYLIAPGSQMWRKHRSRFVCDSCCHGEEWKLPIRSRRRRKGVGSGWGVLSAGPCTLGTVLGALVATRERLEYTRFGALRWELRWGREGRRTAPRGNCVLIPNHPGVRTGLGPLTRLHPPLEGVNRPGWLFVVLPGTGIN